MSARPEFIDIFFQTLKVTAQRSSCSECKDAALLSIENHIIATAYNGATSGCEHCMDYWKRKHTIEWEQYQKTRSDKLHVQKTSPSKMTVDTNWKPSTFDSTNKRSLSASNLRKKSLSKTQDIAKAIKKAKAIKDDTDIASSPGSSRSDEDKEEFKQYLTLSKTVGGSYERYIKSDEFKHDHEEWTNLNENHAVLNLIGHAADRGIKTRGTILYCLYSPCLQCAKLLVAAGIARVFFKYAESSEGLQYLRDKEVPIGKYTDA